MSSSPYTQPCLARSQLDDLEINGSLVCTMAEAAAEALEHTLLFEPATTPKALQNSPYTLPCLAHSQLDGLEINGSLVCTMEEAAAKALEHTLLLSLPSPPQHTLQLTTVHTTLPYTLTA